MFGIGTPELFLIVILTLLVICPIWRIVSKAGFHGAWSLLWLIPLFGFYGLPLIASRSDGTNTWGIYLVPWLTLLLFVLLWVFALRKWPVQKELEILKGVPKAKSLDEGRKQALRYERESIYEKAIEENQKIIDECRKNIEAIQKRMAQTASLEEGEK